MYLKKYYENGNRCRNLAKISTGLLEKGGENGSKCGKFRIIVFLACESTYLFDIFIDFTHLPLLNIILPTVGTAWFAWPILWHRRECIVHKWEWN